jgi:hypothetical protein
LGTFGAVTRVQSKRGNARWTTAITKLPPYAIVRIRLTSAPTVELTRLARAWCGDTRSS